MVAVSFELAREAFKELVVALDLRVNQLEQALSSLFVVGQERLSPPERLERANAVVRFADQLIVALEKLLVRLKEATDKARNARERFTRAQGPRLGFNMA